MRRLCCFRRTTRIDLIGEPSFAIDGAKARCGDFAAFVEIMRIEMREA
jgi:hypothetical protein